MAAKRKAHEAAVNSATTSVESDVEEPPGSRRLFRASASRSGREARSGASRPAAALLEAPAELTSEEISPEAQPRESRAPAREPIGRTSPGPYPAVLAPAGAAGLLRPALSGGPRRLRAEVRPRGAKALDLKEIEVLVLFSRALKMERGRPEDMVADEETELVARGVVESLQGQVRAVRPLGVWEDVRRALRRAEGGAPSAESTVVFNLVESLGGEAYTEYIPPRLFRRLGFRYTGAPEEALRISGSKLLTKKVFDSNGLATPRYQLVRRKGQKRFDVPLPAIVKPANEGGSLGITHEAIVRDAEALAARVDFVIETYRQPALIEEYIAGRELNVAVWGNNRPEILPISEIDFLWTDDPLCKIVSFASKWDKDSVEYQQTPGICPAPLKLAERKRVEAAALKAYRLLGMEGYARVDVRLRDGIPYLLEVNGNPDLAAEAGFFRSARAAGHTYESMIARIVELGLERPAVPAPAAARPRPLVLPSAVRLAAAS